MKSITEKEQQEVCENLGEIINDGMKTIEELSVAFGRVARAICRNKSYTTVHEINKRFKVFKKEEI